MKERKPPERPRTIADRFGDVIDQVVFAFRPVAGAKRMEFRRRFRDAVMSAHEGASKGDATRGSSWIGSRLSPDSALEEDLAELRSRSRELYRNDSVGGAVDTRCNLVVSYGFTPQASIMPREGQITITEQQAELWNDQLEQVYDQVYPRIVVTGKENLWHATRLAERHLAVDGEALLVLSDIGDSDKPIPLAIEVVDPERLETPLDKVGNPRIRMGIEYDPRGKIVAYWIRKTHPGDTKEVNFQYDRVPADRVLHVYEKWFAGQSRAYPWMTRTLNRIKDAKDVGEATIIAQQVQSCFAVFIESPDPYGGAVAAASSTAATGQRIEEIRPGGIHRHRTGEKVSFASPSAASNSFGPFMEWNDRKQAAGMNFPYEMLAKNWGGLSFAAGRLVLAECRLFVEAEQKLLTEGILSPIWNRMVEEAVIVGAVDIPPDLYRKMPWAFQAHEWGPPAWPFALTPREEIEAAVAAIDANLTTKQKTIARFGGWWREVFKQRAVERAEERELEIEPVGKSAPAPAAAAAPAAKPKEPTNADEELEAEAAV